MATKRVFIQELPRHIVKTEEIKKHFWYAPEGSEILLSQQNMEANVFSHPNEIFGMFFQAYANHKGVQLSPDDFYEMILLELSKIINIYFESARDKFVDFKEKKQLTIKTAGENILPLFIDEIKKYAKDGVVDDLSVNFTTSTPFDHLMRAGCVMTALKKYFDFKFEISCGITHVDFLGTLEDWLLLIKKVENLEKYSFKYEYKNLEDEVVSYFPVKKLLERVLPVFKKFVDTYRGEVDVKWWNNIFVIHNVEDGYGPTKECTGWITQFLLGQPRALISKFHALPNIDVSIQVEDLNETYNAKLAGGFSGLHFNTELQSYRPQSSFTLFRLPPKDLTDKTLVDPE